MTPLQRQPRDIRYGPYYATTVEQTRQAVPRVDELVTRAVIYLRDHAHIGTKRSLVDQWMVEVYADWDTRLTIQVVYRFDATVVEVVGVYHLRQHPDEGDGA